MMVDNKKSTAVVLSAGKGKRMNTDIAKQYLLIKDRPVLYYSLKAFEDSFVDEIIVVSGRDDVEFVKREIVEKYNFSKVTKIVAGGAERYHSVLNGLRAISNSDYVFIHDGARPFINKEILDRAYEAVNEFKAAVVAMPVKDTIKIIDDNNVTVSTPDRNHVWMMQTPQVFSFPLIKEAYEKMIAVENNLIAEGVKITDDAMVMEQFGDVPVHVVEGSYRNIKITTPEDIIIANSYIE